MSVYMKSIIDNIFLDLSSKEMFLNGVTKYTNEVVITQFKNLPNYRSIVDRLTDDILTKLKTDDTVSAFFKTQEYKDKLESLVSEIDKDNEKLAFANEQELEEAHNKMDGSFIVTTTELRSAVVAILNPAISICETYETWRNMTFED